MNDDDAARLVQEYLSCSLLLCMSACLRVFVLVHSDCACRLHRADKSRQYLPWHEVETFADNIEKENSPCFMTSQLQLKQAVENSEFADVQFKIGNKTVVSGHRSVLVSRSEVFAGMFQNDTLEKVTGIVNLQGVTEQGLRTFADFIYIGVCPEHEC